MKFFKLILLVIIILLLAVPLADACTPLERDLVFKEGELLCKVYKKDCTFTELRDKHLLIYTTNMDMIFITSRIRELYSKEQLRGAIYHEVGHVVMEHLNKINGVEAQCGKDCNREVINNMNRRFEFQADKFAVLVSKFLHLKADLEGGLMIITPPEHYYTTHPTHPSTADRIKRIRQLRYE